MGNHSYSLEQKIKFLDVYEENHSIAAAVKALGIMPDVAQYWLKHKDEIRQDYTRSLEPTDLAAFASTNN